MFNNNPEFLIKITIHDQLFARGNLKIHDGWVSIPRCRQLSNYSARNNAEISRLIRVLGGVHIFAKKKREKKQIPFVTFVPLCLNSWKRLSKHGYLALCDWSFRGPFGRKLIALHIILISVGGSKIRPESLRNETLYNNSEPEAGCKYGSRRWRIEQRKANSKTDTIEVSAGVFPA